MSQKTEVAVREPSLVEVIQQICSMPAGEGMDRVAMLERIVALKERSDEQLRRREFAAALSRLQAKLPQIDRRGKIVVSGEVRSRYAKLEDLDAQIKPFLSEEGFAFSFDTQPIDGKPDIRIIGRLSHSAGHYEEKSLDLPIDDGGAKSKVQQRGSTVSYGKRQLIKMHLAIVERDEDNDGQGNPELVTAKDLKAIREQIAATETDETKFLAYLKAESLEDIQRRDVPKAMAALRAKAGKKAEDDKK